MFPHFTRIAVTCSQLTDDDAIICIRNASELRDPVIPFFSPAFFKKKLILIKRPEKIVVTVVFVCWHLSHIDPVWVEYCVSINIHVYKLWTVMDVDNEQYSKTRVNRATIRPDRIVDNRFWLQMHNSGEYDPRRNKGVRMATQYSSTCVAYKP